MHDIYKRFLRQVFKYFIEPEYFARIRNMAFCGNVSIEKGAITLRIVRRGYFKEKLESKETQRRLKFVRSRVE